MDLPPFTTFVTLDTWTTRSCRQELHLRQWNPAQTASWCTHPPDSLSISDWVQYPAWCDDHRAETAMKSDADGCEAPITASFVGDAKVATTPEILSPLPSVPLFCLCHLPLRPGLYPFCLCPWDLPMTHQTLQSPLLLLSWPPAMKQTVFGRAEPCYNQKPTCFCLGKCQAGGMGSLGCH